MGLFFQISKILPERETGRGNPASSQNLTTHSDWLKKIEIIIHCVPDKIETHLGN